MTSWHPACLLGGDAVAPASNFEGILVATCKWQVIKVCSRARYSNVSLELSSATKAVCWGCVYSAYKAAEMLRAHFGKCAAWPVRFGECDQWQFCGGQLKLLLRHQHQLPFEDFLSVGNKLELESMESLSCQFEAEVPVIGIQYLRYHHELTLKSTCSPTSWFSCRIFAATALEKGFMNLSSGVPDSLLFIYHAKKSVHISNYSTRDINPQKISATPRSCVTCLSAVALLIGVLGAPGRGDCWTGIPVVSLVHQGFLPWRASRWQAACFACPFF